MKAFIEYLVQAVVDIPEEVRVEEEPGDDDATIYKVHVAPDDLGKVIGRGGRIARSLRIVARAAGARPNRRVVLEIAE